MSRELLELAAKAAGIESLYWTQYGHKCFQCNGKIQKPWNPLEDDGDALRLAVSLGLLDGGNRYMTLRTEEILNGLDPYAATRLAIVRAAAEIGRAI